MSNGRTLYHLVFAELLKERAPPGIRVFPEWTLATEPQRADFLLLRQEGEVRHDDQARTLRRLWPLLPSDTLVEYKSPSRPVRRGDVFRLLGYGAQYFTMEVERLRRVDDLVLVLVVANITPTLDEELATLRWPRSPLGDGYYRLGSQPFPALLVVVDEISEAEHDELLDLVGHRKMESYEAAVWFRDHAAKETGLMINLMEASKMEGFAELFGPLFFLELKRMPPGDLAETLEHLPTPVLSSLLASLPSSFFAAHLSPSRRLLTLDDEALRQFPSAYIDSQPPDVRDEIRRRIVQH